MLPQSLVQRIDWVLLCATVPLLAAGLLTMQSLNVGGTDYFFVRQLLWIAISLGVCGMLAFVDMRLLRRGGVLVALYLCAVLALVGLALFGETIRGVTSWLSVGGVSLQPADFTKLLLIIILAKYFSRRHVAIRNIQHIIVSGLYAFVLFVLVFLQPDFGSAIIIFSIWLAMIMVSGISKRHLAVVFAVAALAFALAWFFVLHPYQQARIVSFLHPLADREGAGYNAYQSTIAVGSGGLIGKGLGYGTQSRLRFLPEYQTDFIFAAFAEEWGFVGVALIFILFGVILWRVGSHALHGASNFESLFAVGYGTLLASHIVIHVGMNVGVLPVTGLPLPFMSYGGSHLLAEFIGLGILLSMYRSARAFHRDDVKNEFLGPA